MTGRLKAALESLMIGLLFGALLAALADVISSTPLGVAATLLIGFSLGWLAGRFGGAVVGLMYSALLCGFGALLSGSVATVVFTIVGSGLLAAWLGWVFHRPGDSFDEEEPIFDSAERQNHYRGLWPVRRFLSSAR